MSAQMRLQNSFLRERVQDSDPANLDPVNPEFEALLEYLKHRQGCDFTSYKRSSLMRRFQHRMQTLNIQTYQHYLEYLQSHSEEYRDLLNDVLINFTSFFRDHDTWKYLAAEIIPQIIASKQPDEPIRVWSAGCASGQESYTLLILFAEALGLEGCLQRVRCFGTDADEAALKQARLGTYSNQEVSDIPPELLQKYFEPTAKGYVFEPRLRRAVVFSRHDLTQDPPISKIDLLVCRNVLIYFNADAQAAILARFHFALKNTGFLFLGKAETLITRRQIFAPVKLQLRIYTKGLKLELDDYLSIRSKSSREPANLLPIQIYFWETTFETSTAAHLAIDAASCLLYANEQARTLFNLSSNDWQCPFETLELAKFISPNLVTRALHTEQRLTRLRKVKWTTETGSQYFDVEIVRVLSPKNRLLGVTLTLIETSIETDAAIDAATNAVTNIKTNTETQINTEANFEVAKVTIEPDPNKQREEHLIAELASAHSELARLAQILAETRSELSMAHGELDSNRKELEVLYQELRYSVTNRDLPSQSS